MLSELLSLFQNHLQGVTVYSKLTFTLFPSQHPAKNLSSLGLKIQNAAKDV